MIAGVNQKCELNLITTKQVSIVNCNSTYQSRTESIVHLLKLIELPTFTITLLPQVTINIYEL